jgi:broad specificity phosphatase PhoE
MLDEHPMIYIARHCETAWSRTGQHTGLTDLPLTERGQRDALRLADRLRWMTFSGVWTSPLQRATRTCELAGFGSLAQVDRDLVEWDYGQYEGRRTAEIRTERPDWQIFRDGCPGGETPAQVIERADRVVKRLRDVQGNTLLFSSGHFIRTFAARWLGLEPEAGSVFFMLNAGSLSALGSEAETSRPVVWLWNETHHLET